MLALRGSLLFIRTSFRGTARLSQTKTRLIGATAGPALWLARDRFLRIRASRDAGAGGGWHDSAMPPSVLIVDDHDDFRASARALLELDGFLVVGDVEDGEAALEAAGRLRPDVVLLDVQLPGMDGFEVAERLAATAEAPRVVLISSRRRSAYDARLPGAAVAGFLGKHELSGAALAALL
jgi:CheY-like chemotaxis protein